MSERTERERQIDYIEFTAEDPERAKRFYQAVFGWKFTDYGPDYTSFDDGRLAGGFRRGERSGGGGPLAVIYSGELEAMQVGIRENGGRIVRDTFDFPGGRRFHFADPEGNELAVWSDQ